MVISGKLFIFNSLIYPLNIVLIKQHVKNKTIPKKDNLKTERVKMERHIKSFCCDGFIFIIITECELRIHDIICDGQ